MSLLAKFKTLMMGEEYIENKPEDDKSVKTTIESIRMIPFIDYKNDAIVKDYIRKNHIDLNYSKNDEQYEDQVDAIITLFYDNFDKLKVRTHTLDFPAKGYEIWIGNDFWGYSISTDIKGLEKLEITHRQGVRIHFLLAEIKEYRRKKALEKLNESLKLDKVSTNRIYTKSAGIINVTQEDIIESLKVTHPQFFV